MDPRERIRARLESALELDPGEAAESALKAYDRVVELTVDVLRANDRLVTERMEALRGVGDLTDGRMEALLEGGKATAEEIRTMIWWLRHLREQAEVLEGRVQEVVTWKAEMRTILLSMLGGLMQAFLEGGIEPPADVRASVERFRRVLQDEERRTG